MAFDYRFAVFTSGSPTFKTLLLVAFLSSSTGEMLHAQTANASPKATPVPTTIPATIPRAEPVKKPKNPGFLERVFGKKPSPTPTFTPEQLPTPKPKIRKRPKATPTPEDATSEPESTPENKSTTTPAVDPSNPGLVPLPDSPLIGSPDQADTDALPASLPPMTNDSVEGIPKTVPNVGKPSRAPEVTVPTAKATPIPAEIRNNPMNQPIPLVDGSEPLQITPGSISPAEEREKVAQRRVQFQKVKAKALEDNNLKTLKEKSELASNSAERYAALKQFYPKLFAAMRKIDGTLGVEIDEMEAAARRRLERIGADSAANSPAP